MRELNIKTYAELAEKAGLTQGAISRYLGGRIPKVEPLLKLCRALECDPNYLLDFRSSESEKNQ